MKNLSQHEWKRLCENQDDAIILDVRTEYEYLDGNIPQSINIDILNPQDFMSEIDSSINHLITLFIVKLEVEAFKLVL